MHVVTSALLLSALIVSPTAAQPRKITLLSAQQNLALDDVRLFDTGRPHDSPWQVTLETLHGGKQEGVRLITLDNGVLSIRVVPTRGLSILDVRDSRTGQRLLGWDSPVKEIVHPGFINLDSRGGLGWLDGFNEWMVRCGLEFAGHPGEDRFITNTGDEATMDLTLHGKIGNIPASEVELIIDGDHLRLRGIVHERMFFGPRLQLTAELATRIGSHTLELHDEVTNHASADQEFQLVYHVNFGSPLLEEGSQVHVPAKSVRPMNDTARPGLETYATYAAPTPGFIEQVYLVEPLASDDHHTRAVLHTRDGRLGVEMAWSTRQLPFFTIWKNTVAESDGYVTGLEPATGYTFHRRVERAAGRLPKLAPGESRRFDLSVTLLPDHDAVRKSVAAVEALQQRQPVELIPDPPEVE